MDDHAYHFAMHRRINAAIVLDDAVDGRCPATADELTGRERQGISSLTKLAHAGLGNLNPPTD